MGMGMGKGGGREVGNYEERDEEENKHRGERNQGEKGSRGHICRSMCQKCFWSWI